MQKGDSIIVSEIKNGVMIEPERNYSSPTAIQKSEIISFQHADDFLAWIREHFNVYEVPRWGMENKKE